MFHYGSQSLHLMPIIQGTMVSHKDFKRICDHIHNKCIQEFDVNGLRNPKYLPLREFQSSLLRQDRISAIIQKHFKRESKELVDYCERNPNIFRILVFTSLLNKLEPLRSYGFKDSYLPIYTLCPDKQWEVYSMAGGKKNILRCFPQALCNHAEDEEDLDGNGIEYGPEMWDWDELEKLKSGQWIFLAPIFDTKPLKLKYDLHYNCPLPYDKIPAAGASTTLSTHDGPSASGHFGRVWRLGLREEYLKVSYKKYRHLRKVGPSQLPISSLVLLLEYR